MSFASLEEIVQYSQTKQMPFWESILEDDMTERGVSRENSMEQMKHTWDAILYAARHYEPERKSASGLVGGQGQKMEEYCTEKTPLCGDFVGKVITGALQMAESNACMKRIVARLRLVHVVFSLQFWCRIMKRNRFRRNGFWRRCTPPPESGR